MVVKEIATFSGGFRAGLTGKRRPSNKEVIIGSERYVLKKKKRKKK